MNEKTKRKEKNAQKTEEKARAETQNSAARDQTEKKYYYDDGHGYEIYDPETGDEETDEN